MGDIQRKFPITCGIELAKLPAGASPAVYSGSDSQQLHNQPLIKSKFILDTSMDSREHREFHNSKPTGTLLGQPLEQLRAKFRQMLSGKTQMNAPAAEPAAPKLRLELKFMNIDPILQRPKPTALGNKR